MVQVHGSSDHEATCVMTQSWCGRAGGIDGPARVMALWSCRPHPPTSTSTSIIIIIINTHAGRQVRLRQHSLKQPLCTLDSRATDRLRLLRHLDLTARHAQHLPSHARQVSSLPTRQPHALFESDTGTFSVRTPWMPPPGGQCHRAHAQLPPPSWRPVFKGFWL